MEAGMLECGCAVFNNLLSRANDCSMPHPDYGVILRSDAVDKPNPTAYISEVWSDPDGYWPKPSDWPPAVNPHRRPPDPRRTSPR